MGILKICLSLIGSSLSISVYLTRLSLYLMKYTVKFLFTEQLLLVSLKNLQNKLVEENPSILEEF